MSNSGINRLIAVTQMKVQDANDEAKQGADQMRDIMDRKKVLRNAKRALEQDMSDGKIDNIHEHQGFYNTAKGAHGSIDGAWKFTNPNTGQTSEGTYGKGTKGWGSMGDSNAWDKANKATFEGLKNAYADAIEDLESTEKLGHNEIQMLMSQYNQNEQLAGSVFKKMDDAGNAIIGKI